MNLKKRLAKLEDARTNEAPERPTREEIDALLERILPAAERSREKHGAPEISPEERRERLANLREALRKRAGL